jgi:hypothetical protein
MNYAESIKYGGEWVAANQCNHTSAANLGLICPECKELVFWVEGHTRNYKDGNQTEIKPRFNHHKKAGAECELRVNSISREQLEQRNALARGQRLEKIKRWFWTIFSNYFISELEAKWSLNQFVYAIRKASGIKHLPLTHYGDNFKTVGSDFWEMQLDDFRDYFLEGASAGDTGFLTAIMVFERSVNTRSKTIVQNPYELSEAQLNLQLDIVKEVIELLLTNQQTDLRNKACAAIAWTLMQLFKDSKYSALMQSALNEIKAAGMTRAYASMPPYVQSAHTTLAQAQFAALALIPWGAEFERLEAGMELERELTEVNFPQPEIPDPTMDWNDFYDRLDELEN